MLANKLADIAQVAIPAILIKGTGSTFRIWDDWHAPKPIRNNTIKRELAVLGQMALYTILIREAMAKNVTIFLDLNRWSNKTLIKSTIKTSIQVASIGLAEVMSRVISPLNKPWNIAFRKQQALKKQQRENQKNKDLDPQDKSHPSITKQPSRPLQPIPDTIYVPPLAKMPYISRTQQRTAFYPVSMQNQYYPLSASA